MIAFLSAILEPILIPLVSQIISSIFTKQKADPEFAAKLIEASEQYRSAKTNEEKRLARIKLINLSR